MRCNVLENDVLCNVLTLGFIVNTYVTVETFQTNNAFLTVHPTQRRRPHFAKTTEPRWRKMKTQNSTEMCRLVFKAQLQSAQDTKRQTKQHAGTQPQPSGKYHNRGGPEARTRQQETLGTLSPSTGCGNNQ